MSNFQSYHPNDSPGTIPYEECSSICCIRVNAQKIQETDFTLRIDVGWKGQSCVIDMSGGWSHSFGIHSNGTVTVLNADVKNL